MAFNTIIPVSFPLVNAPIKLLFCKVLPLRFYWCPPRPQILTMKWLFIKETGILYIAVNTPRAVLALSWVSSQTFSIKGIATGDETKNKENENPGRGELRFTSFLWKGMNPFPHSTGTDRLKGRMSSLVN